MLRRHSSPEEKARSFQIRRDRKADEALRYIRFCNLRCQDCGSDAADIYQWGRYTCPCTRHRDPGMDVVYCNPCHLRRLQKGGVRAYSILKTAGEARQMLRAKASVCITDQFED